MYQFTCDDCSKNPILGLRLRHTRQPEANIEYSSACFATKLTLVDQIRECQRFAAAMPLRSYGASALRSDSTDARASLPRGAPEYL